MHIRHSRDHDNPPTGDRRECDGGRLHFYNGSHWRVGGAPDDRALDNYYRGSNDDNQGSYDHLNDARVDINDGCHSNDDIDVRTPSSRQSTADN